MDILDRVLSLIKMDRSSRSTRRFLREYNRRYPELTRKILESIDELVFDRAVVDYVQLKVEQDYENEDAIISRMSPGIQAVYMTWWVQAEVDNGGLHQYFYNKGVDWAFKALEGYRLLGAPKHAAVMARAIEVYLHEEAQQAALRTGNVVSMLEEYVEARKESALPELDRLFSEVRDESVIDLAFTYMRHHMEEFITC